MNRQLSQQLHLPPQCGGVQTLKKILLACVLATATLCIPSFATPQYLYGNNATFGAPYIYEMNPTTGAVVQEYDNLSGFNGRGVVVYGDTIYYTTAGDNNVYKESLSGVNEGIAFSVSGSRALSTIAFDGTNFWIGDYSGTNHAYLYTPSGT